MEPNVNDELHKVTLVDGLPVERDGQVIRYRIVHLRETTVADERAALRMAERVVMVGGQPKLLVSDEDFRFALTMRHVAAFECDGQRIDQVLIDLALFSKLSSHDLGLIEQKVMLLTLASQVRYGNISQADFEAIASGNLPGAAQPTPQPVGQVAAVGANASDAGPGPALLADYAGRPAGGAPSGAAG